MPMQALQLFPLSQKFLHSGVITIKGRKKGRTWSHGQCPFSPSNETHSTSNPCLREFHRFGQSGCMSKSLGNALEYLQTRHVQYIFESMPFACSLAFSSPPMQIVSVVRPCILVAVEPVQTKSFHSSFHACLLLASCSCMPLPFRLCCIFSLCHCCSWTSLVGVVWCGVGTCVQCGVLSHQWWLISIHFFRFSGVCHLSFPTRARLLVFVCASHQRPTQLKELMRNKTSTSRVMKWGPV
jgi:hypothetical protein